MGGVTACAATCSTGPECASGCCALLSDSSASVCTGAAICQQEGPSSPTPTPPTVPAETYELTNVDRVASNLYKADSGSTQLIIETSLCLALTLRDDGLLVRSDSGGFQLFIDNSSGDVCDVRDIYAAAPEFGTYDLIGVQHVATDIYKAQSGLVDIIVETQLCLELPAFNDGVLIWDALGSQLLIEGPSGGTCDVVNVYTK
jgi:hypothetical protein